MVGDNEHVSGDFIEKAVHRTAIWIYKKHEELVSIIPWEVRDKCFGAFYCGLGVGIAVIDSHASRLISFRSLYIIPVIISALSQKHICALIVSVFCALLHVLTLRIAISSPLDDFSLFWNFLPTFIAYLFLTETVCLLKRAMSDALAYNDALYEEMVVMKYDQGRRFENGDADES